MKNIYVGIDPGADGGIAYIDSDGAHTYTYSDEQLIAILRMVDEIYRPGEAVACLEKVGAMPKQGLSSTFKFGKSAGFIEGVLQAFDIPYQMITPQVWKKAFSLIKKDKKESCSVCRKLFPNVNLKRTDRYTTYHDGMAEALLMAEYARRNL
jgi:crossover junction endodeoxyribonuclease RuvC